MSCKNPVTQCSTATVLHLASVVVYNTATIKPITWVARHVTDFPDRGVHTVTPAYLQELCMPVVDVGGRPHLQSV